jgi:hypothetical protein
VCGPEILNISRRILKEICLHLQEVRIVSKPANDGRMHSFAFAEFENTECAAAALACLNGYQYDPEEPQLGAIQLRYARGFRGQSRDARDGRVSDNRGTDRRPRPHPQTLQAGVVDKSSGRSALDEKFQGASKQGGFRVSTHGFGRRH